MQDAHAEKIVQKLESIDQRLTLILKALQTIATAAELVARHSEPPPQRRK